jgi:hypothetical protein
VPRSHEFQFPGARQTLLRSQKGGPRLKTAAVASLQRRRCLPAAASCSFFLHAISLSVRFMPRTAIVAFDAGVEELRRRRLVEIADAQHFPHMSTR